MLAEVQVLSGLSVNFESIRCIGCVQEGSGASADKGSPGEGADLMGKALT